MMERRGAPDGAVSGLTPGGMRGGGARFDQVLDDDLRQIVMTIANLPVSIPRGRGRRVVTLYEALVRMIASGKVYRRAAVMDFIRLVQQAAAPETAVTTPAPAPAPAPAGVIRLQEHLANLRSAARSGDATPADRSAVSFYEWLLELAKVRLPR